MTTTWIIAADASRARILQVTDREKHLDEIEDLVNPEGRVHERELLAGSHPRFSGHGGVGKPSSHATGGPGSDREETSATEHATELFAKRLGAPPKFLGQLRKELGKEVEKLVTDELPKDLSWLDARDIERRLSR